MQAIDTKRRKGAAYGAGSSIIKHHMEVRGLGIINIKDLFGVAAVRDAKKIELVVERLMLVEWLLLNLVALLVVIRTNRVYLLVLLA